MPGVLCLPWGKAIQTRNKRTGGTVAFTYVPGILPLSSVAAILINKHDARGIFPRNPAAQAGSRTPVYKASSQRMANIVSFWDTGSLSLRDPPHPQPPIHRKYRYPQLHKVLSSELVSKNEAYKRDRP